MWRHEDLFFSGIGAGLKFVMNACTRVLDERLRPIAPGSGAAGRVALGGRVPLGYYNDPGKTPEVFAQGDGTRWVMPGDIGVVNADGTVTVLGRGSTCINSGGEKIFPEEVEAVLKSHPSVFDAVVVGVPDLRWGESVAAVVDPRSASHPTLRRSAQALRGTDRAIQAAPSSGGGAWRGRSSLAA